MVELTAKSPLEDRLPMAIGECEIREFIPESITSISPYKNLKNNNKALEDILGYKYPAANRTHGKDGNRLIWMSHDTAFLIGPPPDKTLQKHAALVDQSDGWILLRLTGADSENVLARLTPVDLRAAVFKRGHTARSLIKHVNVSITRMGANGFDLLVMRSFARSLADDVIEAMKTVAAL